MHSNSSACIPGIPGRILSYVGQCKCTLLILIDLLIMLIELFALILFRTMYGNCL